MNPMTSFLRASVAVAGASLFLAACSSPPTWEKAGANETTVANDSNDCRVQARFAPLPERYVPAPTAQSVAATTLSLEERRAMFETDEFQKCMTGKGYTAAKR